jgi:hypothetical protein
MEDFVQCAVAAGSNQQNPVRVRPLQIAARLPLPTSLALQSDARLLVAGQLLRADRHLQPLSR